MANLYKLYIPGFLLSAFFLMPGVTYGCKPTVNLGDTTTFCQGNSITVSAANPNTTYIWSTGATTSGITISTSGQYWVAATNICGTTKDTLYVFADQPNPFNFGANKTICTGSVYTLSPPHQPGNSYLWQDGSTNSTFNVTQAGKYYVKVTNTCGSYSDTIRFTTVASPNLNLGNDITKCDNLPVVLNSGTSGHTVNWNTGQSGNSITVSKSGLYVATITNACGTFKDSVRVTYSVGPGLNLGGTVSLCAGGNISLTTGGNGSHLWSTGVTTNSIVVSAPGTYWVRYTDVCGTFYDTVSVIVGGPANVNLGQDTSLCSGDIFLLDAGYPGSQYIWQDGSTNRYLVAQTFGVYWVGVDNGCGFRYDTIKVSDIPIPSVLPYQQIGLCAGSTQIFNANHFGPNATFLWDDGTTNPTHAYSTIGSHWVFISNECGADTLFFDIRYDSIINIDLGPDDTTCANEIFYDLSHLMKPGDSIIWSNYDTTKFQSIGVSGTYWVSITNACGEFSDTVTYTMLKPPDQLQFNNTGICVGGSKVFSLSYLPITDYLWSTGDTTNSISINQPGQYWFKVSNMCDTVSDTFNIKMDVPIPIDLGPDVVLCEPAIHLLDVSQYQADSVLWSTGSTNGVLPVGKSGTFWVKLYNACGEFSDTINIIINKLPRKKLKDGAFCRDTSFTLDASQTTNCTFLWNTGATTPSITSNQGGWYYVDITNICGTIRDSAFMLDDFYLSPPNLGKDTAVCRGTVTLDAGFVPGVRYLWSNGSPAQSINVGQSGTYYVRMSNSCNTVYDTINVLITGPPIEVLGDKIKFCWGSILTLNAQNPGSTYLWNTGATTQTLSVDSGGVYWCTILNDCGILTDTVQAIVEYPIADLDLGADTIACKGQPLILNTGYPNLPTLWQDGSTKDSYTVTQTGLYWVRVNNTCGQYFDSIYVEVEDVPVFSLGNDTVICAIGGWLELTGPPGMESYLWSNGSTVQNANFTQPGKYWLTVSNHCFSYTDTIRATGEYPINIDLGPDTVLCMTEMYTLNVSVPGYTVTWENGTHSKSREISRSGTYWVSAKNSCGFFSDSVSIRFDYIIDPPLSDTVVCSGDAAVIDLRYMPYRFEWFDGSTQAVRRFDEAGIYSITIFNKCGTFQKDFSVTITDCDCPLFIPKAFTPNGDGKNDEFSLGHSCNLTAFKLEIFSRWGELVYTSIDPSETWDGTNLKGKELPVDTYTYRVKYSWAIYSADRHKGYYGHISLLR